MKFVIIFNFQNYYSYNIPSLYLEVYFCSIVYYFLSDSCAYGCLTCLFHPMHAIFLHHACIPAQMEAFVGALHVSFLPYQFEFIVDVSI